MDGDTRFSGRTRLQICGQHARASREKTTMVVRTNVEYTRTRTCAFLRIRDGRKPS